MANKSTILTHNVSTKTNGHTVASDAQIRTSDGKSEVRPRLLSLKAAAKEFGLSYWILRGWCADGILRPCRLPGTRMMKAGRCVANGHDHKIRKILIDRADLEELIRDSK
jgi:hypothetical protein